MKTFKYISLISLLFIALGCKKEIIQDPPKTVTQKVQGKWKVISLVENEVSSSGTSSYSYNGKSDDYIDFKSDGKVYSKLENQAEDMALYTIDNDTQITIDGDAHVIKALDSKSLVLYHRQGTAAEYYELTLVLGK